MTGEIWRAVPGFEGSYEVSDQGRVRSFVRYPDGRLLKPGKASHGYNTVSIGGKSQCIHNLVLLAFVGPRPFPKAVCRHGDGDRQHSVLSNLSWGTYKENAADAGAHGTRVRGERYTTAKLTDEAVRRMRPLFGHYNLVELASMFHASPAAIQAVKVGRTWKHV